MLSISVLTESVSNCQYNRQIFLHFFPFSIIAYVAVKVLVAYIAGKFIFSSATVSALSVPCLSCSEVCFIVTVLLLMSHQTNKVIY